MTDQLALQLTDITDRLHHAAAVCGNAAANPKWTTMTANVCTEAANTITELRDALAALAEPNHRQRKGSNICDVCGSHWPCDHFTAALLLAGE